MPQPNITVEQFITAPPDVVFGYVADLTRHSRWAADKLAIEPLDATGTAFRSHAVVKSLTFDATLTVTGHQPNRAFSFKGEDKTGAFEHHFTLQPQDGGTLVTRHVMFDLTLRQFLIYCVLLYPVRLPAARKALTQLKHVCERAVDAD